MANPDGDYRDAVVKQSQYGQGEQPPECNVKEDKPYVAEIAEKINQQGKDEHNRQLHGHEAVLLNLPGVRYGYGGRSEAADVDAGKEADGFCRRPVYQLK